MIIEVTSGDPANSASLLLEGPDMTPEELVIAYQDFIGRTDLASSEYHIGMHGTAACMPGPGHTETDFIEALRSAGFVVTGPGVHVPYVKVYIYIFGESIIIDDIEMSEDC